MVTSNDVARLAGVSQSTVSRALHDSDRITRETKERVRRAATELGYVPSQHGRALSTRRSQRIGVLLTELSNPFYMALLDPIHDALREHGYRTALLTDDTHSPLAFNDLVDGSLDGVILTSCRRGSSLPQALRERGVAAVTLNREPSHRFVDSCVMDNAAGAAQVADALVTAGHSRIAYIAGPDSTSTGRERLAGFNRGLATHGLRLAPRLLHRGEFTYDTGFEAMHQLMRAEKPPTAVFCGNDVIALGALSAATSMGLRVPQDVSVVGFDDIPMAGWPLVGLTTVHCDLTELASAGVALLVERLREPDLPLRRHVLAPRLVQRRTLAAP